MLLMTHGHRNVLLRKDNRAATEPVRPVSGRVFTNSPLQMRYPFDCPPSVPPARKRDQSLEVSRAWTQEDQNEVDAERLKAAVRDLVQSWMDRLQLISVVTTFFAAVESQLLGISAPERGATSPRIEQAANSALVGALVVHVFAAIVAFIASFFLVGYKVQEAKIEEHKVEEGAGPESKSADSSVWSRNPRLEQVGPFHGDQPPTNLLERCHSLCVLFGAVGFLLAVVGIVCLAWARLYGSPSIFATVCMSLCTIASITIVFYPVP